MFAKKKTDTVKVSVFKPVFCGERGIRTLGTVTSTTVFETVPFDRSGISPFFQGRKL